MVGLRDVADRHGGDADLVADAVGERGLEHAAVHGARLDRGLAGGDIDDIDTLGLENAGNRHRLHRRDAAITHPVIRGDAHGYRLLRRPHLADSLKDGEREAQAVLQRAAVGVIAAVGERRDEGREQVAVGAVQLQHVEAGAIAHLGGAHELGLHDRHVGDRHLAWSLVLRRPRDRRRRQDLPVAAVQRRVHLLPTELGGALGSRVAELESDLRLSLGVDEIDDALPGRLVLERVHAGATRRDARLRATRKSSR